MAIEPLTATQVACLGPEELLRAYGEHVVEKHRLSVNGGSPIGADAHIEPNLVLLQAEILAGLRLAKVA